MRAYTTVGRSIFSTSLPRLLRGAWLLGPVLAWAGAGAAGCTYNTYDNVPAASDGGSEGKGESSDGAVGVGNPNGSAGDGSSPSKSSSDSGPGASNGGGDSSPAAADAEASTPPAGDGGALGPIDLNAAAIYQVYTPIYSSAGTLAAVTSDLPRISGLGFNVLWVMPVTQMGKATADHPTNVGSPYCVHDYYAVDPALGTLADFAALVSSAHALGMHVILDEALLAAAWDSPLLTTNPEYFVQANGVIQGAFNYPDVAEFDYNTPGNGLSQYMLTMLTSWVQTYDLDGLRLDSADNPYGADRAITQTFWQAMAAQLATVKPGLLLLGEEEDPTLDMAPFNLDYGWDLEGYYGINGAAAAGLTQVAQGASATDLQQTWTAQGTGYPAGTRHMTLMQNWDQDEDLKTYGGVPNTMAAAVFDFTIDGIPMLFNGEEVGNDNSGVNSHTVIDWNSPNAASFQPFYKSLLGLRNSSTALQQGTVAWIQNSSSASVASYTRSDSTGTFLILINFSGGSVTGTVSPPSESGWTDVSPTGSPGGTSHSAPPVFSLAAYDFAAFQAK